MTATIYLVRHGQTYFNATHRMQGSSDSRLTPRGRRQVEATHNFFNDQQITFDKAYCSTQERASDTLEILTDQSIDYRRVKELKEKDYGFFEARNVLWYILFHRFPARPKVEDNRDVITRMERGMNLILRDAQDGDNILVVGHGDAFGQYLREVVGINNFHNFQNAAVVKLMGDGQTLEFVDSYWPAKNVK